MRAWIVAGTIAGVIACGSRRGPLSKAGDDRDEGGGELASASLGLMIGEDEPGAAVAEDGRRGARRYEDVTLQGAGAYGGDPYGGSAYGGATYAGWVVPQWRGIPRSSVPSHVTLQGLSAAIEGTVTWSGPPPRALGSACGPLAHPTLRVASDRGLGGVLVFIEKVTVGRPIAGQGGRVTTVGGTVTKRGCTLVPAAQILPTLPAGLSIHGDAQRAKLRISRERATTTHELQEGGLVQLEARSGITRVEAADGKLSPAWVIGVDTPYYAVTDDAGRYRIDELAPGTYEVTFWQAPIMTTRADGTFEHGPPIVVRRSVTVTAAHRPPGKAAQLSVALSLAR
jgi:hypothetical protein